MDPRERNELTQRQLNEIEYHRIHAKIHQRILSESFSYEVVSDPSRKWWNAYWSMFALLREIGVEGKRVLVVGCGFGDDAIRLARMGAVVTAFDLSPESIEIAASLARRERVTVCFDVMSAERTAYEDASFDLVVMRDILHHVEIVRTLTEVRRVCRPAAIAVVNEIYTHSAADKIRRWKFVEDFIYPRLRTYVYGAAKPYITEDEKKLDEKELRCIEAQFANVMVRKYFYMFVKRFVPERYDSVSKMDRRLLGLSGSLGRLLAGRVLLAGQLGTRATSAAG